MNSMLAMYVYLFLSESCLLGFNYFVHRLNTRQYVVSSTQGNSDHPWELVDFANLSSSIPRVPQEESGPMPLVQTVVTVRLEEPISVRFSESVGISCKYRQPCWE